MFSVQLLVAVISLVSVLINVASSLTIAIEDRYGTITAAPTYQFDTLPVPRGLVRRECSSGYVSHLDGCCLATALRDCGNGVTVCTAECPESSTTTPAASCPSGYVSHLDGCCLSTALRDCGNGVTVCTAECPASSTTTTVTVTDWATVTTTATTFTTVYTTSEIIISIYSTTYTTVSDASPTTVVAYTTVTLDARHRRAVDQAEWTGKLAHATSTILDEEPIAAYSVQTPVVTLLFYPELDLLARDVSTLGVIVKRQDAVTYTVYTSATTTVESLITSTLLSTVFVTSTAYVDISSTSYIGGDVVTTTSTITLSTTPTTSASTTPTTSASTIPTTSASTTPTTSASTIPTTSASTTGSTSLASTDIESILSYIQTGIPTSVQYQSSFACFVNSEYSYYSTPTWWSTLPQPVQSYYSSVNQGQTAACTSPPPTGGTAGQQQQGNTNAGSNNNDSGLSTGAKTGIGVGVSLGALTSIGIILWLWKAGFIAGWLGIAGSAGASATTAAGQPPPSWHGQAGSEGWGGYAGSQGWNGVGGGSGPASPAPPPPSGGNQVPFVPFGMARRSNDERYQLPPNANVTESQKRDELNPGVTELPATLSSNTPWVEYSNESIRAELSAGSERQELDGTQRYDFSHDIPRKPVESPSNVRQ